LRVSLLLAALACVLRPTNALIWLSVSVPTLWQAPSRLRYVLVREVLFCGSSSHQTSSTDDGRSAVLACSVASDRLYYGVWTLPPLRFLYFNIAQSLAVFYGSNRADYYLTEGLPLLLTTALPFAAAGLLRVLLGMGMRHSPITGNRSIRSPPPQVVDDATQNRLLVRLAWACAVTTFTLSLISHKEVRFLYPLLPFLHVLAAGPLTNSLPTNGPLINKAVITFLLLTNIVLGRYVSISHQRGVIDVISHLRHQHEARNNLDQFRTEPQSITNTTIAFLMPCHSTPWRSHLVYPSISAWALTCEPPLDIPLSQRSTYLDEADQFYINPGPAAWLRDNMESLDSIRSGGSRSSRHWMRQDPKIKEEYRRAWPQYLVFFAQLEPVLKEVLERTLYGKCWRGFNSHLHDDSRRKGDVVVWCLGEK
jgi:phosphatidylinositol glycan class B